MTRSARWVTAAVVAAALAPPPARADQIDRVMIEQADGIAKAVRGMGAKNVAVLKFETKLGNAAPSFHGGVTNGMMAKRLENLLILTNDSRSPLMVLTDAGQAVSALARQKREAITWKTEKGRQSLFDVPPLPLAWNEQQKFAPDGYVTGEVVVSPDMRSTEIVLYGFTKGAIKSPKELYRIKDTVLVQGPGGKPQYVSRGIATDRTMLARMGQSFAVKSGKSRGLELDNAEASASAAQADKTGAAPGGELPVRVEVYYAGQLINLEANPNSLGEQKLKLPSTPQAGQKVYFRLINNSATEAYAVLLAVNGKNTVAVNNDTLLAGAKPEAEQKMWALAPGQSGEVHGFYTDLAKGDFQPFDVLPEDASTQQYNLMNDNHLRGMISVRVFGKREGAKPNVTLPGGGGTGNTAGGATPETGPANMTEAQREEALDRMGSAEAIQFAAQDRSIRTSRSLAAAKSKILAATRVAVLPDGKLTGSPQAKSRYIQARSVGRGLIIEGATTAGSGAIEELKVEYDPQPIANWEWEYYSPGSNPAP